MQTMVFIFGGMFTNVFNKLTVGPSFGSITNFSGLLARYGKMKGENVVLE